MEDMTYIKKELEKTRKKMAAGQLFVRNEGDGREWSRHAVATEMSKKIVHHEEKKAFAATFKQGIQSFLNKLIFDKDNGQLLNPSREWFVLRKVYHMYKDSDAQTGIFDQHKFFYAYAQFLHIAWPSFFQYKVAHDAYGRPIHLFRFKPSATNTEVMHRAAELEFDKKEISWIWESVGKIQAVGNPDRHKAIVYYFRDPKATATTREDVSLGLKNITCSTKDFAPKEDQLTMEDVPVHQSLPKTSSNSQTISQRV